MEDTKSSEDCSFSELVMTSIYNEVQQHHHGDDSFVSDSPVVDKWIKFTHATREIDPGIFLKSRPRPLVLTCVGRCSRDDDNLLEIFKVQVVQDVTRQDEGRNAMGKEDI